MPSSDRILTHVTYGVLGRCCDQLELPMYRLISIILALPILSVLTGCERARTKLDREVDRLCAVDGGVHIYETVTLAKENFDANGQVFPQFRGLPLSKGGLGPDFATNSETNVLVSGNPSLERINIKIVRLSDQVTLGELTIYRRSGGDFPGPWEPSRYSCPQGPSFAFETKVFVQGEK